MHSLDPSLLPVAGASPTASPPRRVVCNPFQGQATRKWLATPFSHVIHTVYPTGEGGVEEGRSVVEKRRRLIFHFQLCNTELRTRLRDPLRAREWNFLFQRRHQRNIHTSNHFARSSGPGGQVIPDCPRRTEQGNLRSFSYLPYTQRTIKKPLSFTSPRK
jgi:hypothetical protein